MIKQALKKAYSHKKLFLISMLADILFFFAYGFATAPIYRKLMENIYAIGSLAGEAIQTATRESQSMLSALTSETIRPYFNNIIWLLIILAVTTYLIYCILQALNWKIALEITGKKTRYLDYLKKFLKINIIWFLLFVLYYLLGFAVEIRQILISKITQTAPSSALSIILTAYLIGIAYFAVISYVQKSAKQSWTTGKTKFMQLLPAVLLIAAYFLALNIITGIIGSASTTAAIIAGLLLLVPSLTIARIYIALTIQKA